MATTSSSLERLVASVPPAILPPPFSAIELVAAIEAGLMVPTARFALVQLGDEIAEADDHSVARHDGHVAVVFFRTRTVTAGLSLRQRSAAMLSSTSATATPR